MNMNERASSWQEKLLKIVESAILLDDYHFRFMITPATSLSSACYFPHDWSGFSGWEISHHRRAERAFSPYQPSVLLSIIERPSIVCRSLFWKRYLSNKNLPQIATTDSSSFRGKTVRGEGHPAQSLKLLRHILTFIQRQYHEQSSLVFLRTISMEHEKMRGEGKKA